MLKNVINNLTDFYPNYTEFDMKMLQAVIDTINSKYEKTISPKSIKDSDEPLLSPDNKKYTAFPIKYFDVWEEYKNQVASYWKVEEIDFSNDYNDFMMIDKDEQHFIKRILAFFAASDGIVNFNLSERFIREITVTEVQFTYQFQAMMENVHGIVYSLMLENIVKDKTERETLFNAIETIPSVKMMADWALEWIESDKSFAHRLVAFAIVEGIFFSGAFAAIFWLKKYKHPSNVKPFMNGLITSNKFISRDEGLHYKFACVLYKHIKNKLSLDEIMKILDPALKIAKNFMTDAIPIKLIGMSSESMNQYLEYISDMLLTMMGYPKMYKKENPFRFMQTIGLNDKTNFFELRPHEYQDPHVKNEGTNKKIEILDSF